MGLTYKKLVNTPLVDPIDKLLFQKHQTEIYQMMDSLTQSLVFGESTMISGSVTVVNAKCKSTSIILVSSQDDSATGAIRAIPGAGTFDLKSSSGGDSGRIGWLLIP